MSFPGLQNQGGTCYLNSLLQTLYFTPEFKQELYSLSAQDIYDQNGNAAEKKIILFELLKLFARMQVSTSKKCKPLSTKCLTDSFGWNGDEVLQQHDINDLYNILLDGLNTSMPENKKFLDKYYKGRIGRVTNCMECENISVRFEDFLQINVSLCSQLNNKKMIFNSLYQSLFSMFMDNGEILCGDNMYDCKECHEKVKAKTYSRLVQLPTILIFNLNRYFYEYGNRIKLNTKFVCPRSLELEMFMNQEHSQMDKNIITSYDLIGIVVHSGLSANTGHYKSFIHDMNCIDDQKQNKGSGWFEFNDKKVTPTSCGRIDTLFTNSKAETPYMIIYRRKFMDSSYCTPKIPQYIQKEINIDFSNDNK